MKKLAVGLIFSGLAVSAAGFAISVVGALAWPVHRETSLLRLGLEIGGVGVLFAGIGICVGLVFTARQPE